MVNPDLVIDLVLLVWAMLATFKWMTWKFEANLATEYAAKACFTIAKLTGRDDFLKMDMFDKLDRFVEAFKRRDPSDDA